MASGAMNLRLTSSVDMSSFVGQMIKVSHWANNAAAALSGADPLTSPLFNGGFSWVPTPIYDSMLYLD